jgi:cytochrome b561
MGSVMSAHAEERGSTELSAPAESYDRILKALHWSTLSLITAIYIAIWVRHDAATKEQQAVLMQLHRSLGITVFALTLFRLGWRWHARIPSLPADLPAFQKLAARAIEYLLYALLLVQPLFGILHVNARGRRADFFLLGIRRAAGDHRPRRGSGEASHHGSRVRGLSVAGGHCAARGCRALPSLCPPRRCAQWDAARAAPLRAAN